MATKKKKSIKKAARKAATRATTTTKKRTPKSKAAKKSAKTLASPKSKTGKKLPGKKLIEKKKRAKIANVTTGRSEKAAAVRTRKKTRGPRESMPSSDMLGPDSAGQSGDLQGLSNSEGADSESVDELIEEGNAFEAGIVEGVEESGERGTKEVRTREFPEDDVPGEYLDEE
jgi:hypothetical protein